MSSDGQESARPQEGAWRSFRQSLPRPARATRLESPGAGFSDLDPAEIAVLGAPSVIEAALCRLAGMLPARAEPPAAAVLLALGWNRGGGVKLLVIRRASHLRRNPGELAFPGGAIEPGESIAEAALREAEEEVGLLPEAVRVIGHLPQAAGRSGRPEIAPVVGLVESSPRLRANADEVEEVFLVELERLFDPLFYWEEDWALGKHEAWRMHFFDRGEDVLWGASAGILVSLLEALSSHAKYARPTRQEPSGDSHG